MRVFLPVSSLLLTSTFHTSMRRGPGSNRRIKVLQTSPLPLGYRANISAIGETAIPFLVSQICNKSTNKIALLPSVSVKKRPRCLVGKTWQRGISIEVNNPANHWVLRVAGLSRSLRMRQSGKRGSDPRPQPWQGCALPTELFPH